MAGLVRIGHVAGKVHVVSLDPPIEGLLTASHHASFDHACGYAFGHALALGRRVIDDSGRLTEGQLEDLHKTLIMGAIEEALKRLARGESILPTD